MALKGQGGYEELEGAGRGETVIRIYFMRKKSIFNKRLKTQNNMTKQEVQHKPGEADLELPR